MEKWHHQDWKGDDMETRAEVLLGDTRWLVVPPRAWELHGMEGEFDMVCNHVTVEHESSKWMEVCFEGGVQANKFFGT